METSEGKVAQGGRKEMDTYMDACSQGWNNALWQQLPSHSFTFHDQVSQCIQTEFLRAGQTPKALGLARLKPGREGWGTRHYSLVPEAVGTRG